MEVFKIQMSQKVYIGNGVFSLIEVAPGVATLIFVAFIMNGFRKEFTERIFCLKFIFL